MDSSAGPVTWKSITATIATKIKLSGCAQFAILAIPWTTTSSSATSSGG
jgi:hypothetical protein